MACFRDDREALLTSTGPRSATASGVRVAMADIAGTLKEGLLAMAMGAGLNVVQALMEESVTAL